MNKKTIDESLDALFQYSDGNTDVFDEWEINRPHGELVSCCQEAYFDVLTYEDGYVERISIGD